MRANIILDNVTVYDINHFNVRLGENFLIQLKNEKHSWVVSYILCLINKFRQYYPFNWFQSCDENVLEMNVTKNGKYAKFKTLDVGKCIVTITRKCKIIKVLHIYVYDSELVKLNPTAGKPVLK